jgi:hypothetical protein
LCEVKLIGFEIRSWSGSRSLLQLRESHFQRMQGACQCGQLLLRLHLPVGGNPPDHSVQDEISRSTSGEDNRKQNCKINPMQCHNKLRFIRE